MPSPFPGMDPYLEAPGFWPGVHTSLIVFIGRALNAHLPPGFAANVEERVYLQPEARSVRPDVVIRSSPVPRNVPTDTGRGGTAVLERPVATEPEEDAPHEIFLLSPLERERFIEVVSVGDEQRIITVIEVLSHANKTPGGGRNRYVNKQEAILQSETHLLEIDLLRDGSHTVAAPEYAVREQVSTYNYLISLHRANRDEERYQFWTKNVRDPLPRKLLVPLTSGVPDVLLDLQGAFNEAYDAGPYSRQVDYTASPLPPLAAGDDVWAGELLQAAGLRSAAPPA